MYNKKCISTFLFVLALISLLTLIIPFMNVGFTGNPSVVVKIFYYIFIVIYAISLVGIIGFGIYNLFQNNFLFVTIQETLSYISLIMVILIVVIVMPILNVGLTIGFSVLALETFVMACLNNIIRLFKRLPKSFNSIYNYFKNKHDAKKLLKEKQKAEENKNNKHQLKFDLDNPDHNIIDEDNVDEVKIIPPDDEIV